MTDNFEKVLKDHSQLISSIVSHISKGAGSQEDLMQAGKIGLWEAFTDYTGVNGASFTTYAAKRVAGAVLDEMRNLDPISRYDRKIEGEGDTPQWLQGIIDSSDMILDHTQNEIIEESNYDAKEELKIILNEVSHMGLRYQYIFYATTIGETIAKIGKQIGIGGSRVSQIHSEIVKYLKDFVEDKQPAKLIDNSDFNEDYMKVLVSDAKQVMCG